jgi:plasmid maintenance system antidote protein VapI
MVCKLLSTGQIIAAYLEANNLSIFDLAKSSGVGLKTIYRLVNDESKLSYKIAQGMNRLISEVSLEFLVSYDAKYQLQKNRIKEQYQVDDLTKIIDFYKLRKLYRNYYHDNIKLVEIAGIVFGYDNVKKLHIDDSPLFSRAFSQAKNADNTASLLWLAASYKECLVLCEQKELLIFDYEIFKKEFSNIKKICGTTDIRSTIFNMKSFCESCGINFYYRPSIPNSRVKAAALKDKEGRAFLFISDLFKCVENLWISFVHECMHILKQDFTRSNPEDFEKIANYENYIDVEAMKFFVDDFSDLILNMDSNGIIDYAKRTRTPIGIVAEIYRYLTKRYDNRNINMYVHYYKFEDLEWKPPFN